MQHDTNSKQMKIRGTVFILYEIDFKTKSITRYKDGYFIIRSGTFLQDNIIITNIYAPHKESTYK